MPHIHFIVKACLKKVHLFILKLEIALVCTDYSCVFLKEKGSEPSGRGRARTSCFLLWFQMVCLISDHTGRLRYLRVLSTSTVTSSISSSGFGSGMGMMYSLCRASPTPPSVWGRGVGMGWSLWENSERVSGNGAVGTGDFTRTTAGWSLVRKLLLTWEYLWQTNLWRKY